MSSAYSVSSGMKDAGTGGFGIGWVTSHYIARVTGMLFTIALILVLDMSSLTF